MSMWHRLNARRVHQPPSNLPPGHQVPLRKWRRQTSFSPYRKVGPDLSSPSLYKNHQRPPPRPLDSTRQILDLASHTNVHTPRSMMHYRRRCASNSNRWLLKLWRFPATAWNILTTSRAKIPFTERLNFLIGTGQA